MQSQGFFLALVGRCLPRLQITDRSVLDQDTEPHVAPHAPIGL